MTARTSLLLALVLAACAGAAPTPQIIYVTPAPAVLATPTAATEPTETAPPGDPTVVPTIAATAQPTPTDAPVPVTITGKNDGNTKRFELGLGDWQVVVSGDSTSQFGGNVVVYVVDEAGERSLLTNEIVDGGLSYEFATYEYGYSGGLYYLDVSAPAGSWAVVFTPEPAP